MALHFRGSDVLDADLARLRGRLVRLLCGAAMNRDDWIALIGAAVFAALLVLAAPALAHDHGRPNLDGWYQSLRSPAGSSCCDGPEVDAVHLADADWESNAGRYRVRIDGQWVDVPPDAVLTVPNRDGRTLVWPTWDNGKRTVRCFMPGSMS